jgi:hypothetical protein
LTNPFFASLKPIIRAIRIFAALVDKGIKLFWDMAN